MKKFLRVSFTACAILGFLWLFAGIYNSNQVVVARKLKLPISAVFGMREDGKYSYFQWMGDKCEIIVYSLDESVSKTIEKKLKDQLGEWQALPMEDEKLREYAHTFEMYDVTSVTLNEMEVDNKTFIQSLVNRADGYWIYIDEATEGEKMIRNQALNDHSNKYTFCVFLPSRNVLFYYCSVM